MNHPDREDELEAWLRRSSSLHEQLARLDRSDPPEELDRSVLDHARSAIRAPRRMRWGVPVALAAGVLLSFVLVLHVSPWPAPTGAAPEATAAGEQALRIEAAQQSPDVAASEQRPARNSAARDAPERSHALQKAPAPPADALRDERADADVWLAAIAELRAQGRHAEAEREWEAFVRAHPQADEPAAAAPAPDR